MHKSRILILYPDPSGLALLTSMLKSLGHLIEEATNGPMAVKLMERNEIHLVLAGVEPSDNDALELLMYMRRKHRDVPVVLLFPRLHPERAKEALRQGAMAVLKYPVPAAELRAAVVQALENCEGRSTDLTGGSVAAGHPAPSPHRSKSGPAVQATGAAPEQAHHSGNQAGPHPNSVTSTGAVSPAIDVPVASAPGPVKAPAHRVEQLAREIGLLGGDPGWRQILDLTATIGATRASVLIVGEPGTGKSLLARLIHSLGPNPDRPFVTVEAVAMADAVSIQESGDYLASVPIEFSLDWSTKLNQARGGTLYVDEVGALPLEIQHQLLRELQYRDYEATAGHSSILGEVRFVMSTSESLAALIEPGRIRRELYHRASVISLTLPPLRYRGADIELLAEAFRSHYAQEFHKSVTGFTRDALEALHRHEWPGNVPELEGAIKRAVALCNGPRINSSHLATILNHNRHSRATESNPRPHLPMSIRPLKEALEEPEKRIIIQALQAFNWNRQETARVLDINRTTLYKKMKKYGLLVDEPTWAN